MQAGLLEFPAPAAAVDLFFSEGVLQRFFYWNISKLLYQPGYSLEQMNHINFDWFRSLNCHRRTREEVINFCESAELSIENINIQNSDITIVVRKLLRIKLKLA